jgi:hypothetical protein
MASSALSILPPARMLDFAASELHTTERCGLLPRHDTITIDREVLMLKLFLTVSILSGLMAAGCSAHYYRVTDPESGKTYYTNKVERVWQGGALNFEDAQSGNSVTLQNTEVKELSEGEFMATLALNQPSRETVEANFTNVDF